MSRKQRIHSLLTANLQPLYLVVEDESKHHRVPAGAETHFKVVAVSEAFIDLSKIARHRLIHGLLADELAQGLHALTLHLYTNAEWEKRGRNAVDSPACRGGSRHG